METLLSDILGKILFRSSRFFHQKKLKTLLLTIRMHFSQPGRKFPAKVPKPFALSATEKSKDKFCERNYQTTPQIKLKVFLTTFSKNFCLSFPKNFPKMSEETKQKKTFPKKVLERFSGLWTSKTQFRQPS